MKKINWTEINSLLDILAPFLLVLVMAFLHEYVAMVLVMILMRLDSINRLLVKRLFTTQVIIQNPPGVFSYEDKIKKETIN